MRQFGNWRVKTKYDKLKIMTSLTKFRDAHVEHYTKAVEAYFIELNKRVATYAEKVKYASVPLPPMSNNFGLTPPVNEFDSYDKMIKLFSLSTDCDIELTMEEANSVFNDEWDWIKTAKFINETYYNEAR